jgi:hypothetical protein
VPIAEGEPLSVAPKLTNSEPAAAFRFAPQHDQALGSAD